MSVLFFILAAVALLLALNGIRPPLMHRPAIVRPPWMAAMVTNEFAPAWFAAVAVGMAVAEVLGVRDRPAGRWAFVLAGITLILLAWTILRSAGALTVVRKRLGPSVSVPRPAYDWSAIGFPYPYRALTGIERIDDVEYAPGLRLDLYRSPALRSPAPLLIHVHGGSWGGGSRREQAQPLIREMARRGWLVAAIDYPLTPAATFPDQVIAIHGALRWFRDRSDELDLDPASITLTGGSAGAHLASLVALTDAEGPWTRRRPDEPPVAAGVVYYGVYDLLDRHGIRDVWPILSLALIKADPEEEPEKFHLGSPIDHIGDATPPMLIVHGVADSLVPVEESEYFALALAERSGTEVVYVPVPGATHAFDAVPSLRTQHVVAGTAAWLEAAVRS